MATLTINKVRIIGMSACVPTDVEENLSVPLFANEDEANKVIEATGIERRHMVKEGTTASDLGCLAVEKLIVELGWNTESVDALFFVSQTRDYIAPQTACILQDRLGLSQGCFAIDLPLGCSGFIYGISVAASMISHGGFKRAILINAETNSKNRSMKDRTVRPLFGDAATATALVFDENAKPMNFVFGVDGSGWDAIYAKFGGMRYPTTPDSLVEKEYEPGIIRRGVDMVVNGMDVFAFAIRQPARSLRELIAVYNIDVENVDMLLLHQANKFIDEKIRKSLKIPKEKCPYCLQNFGNVTSASIPLTLVSQCKFRLSSQTNHIIACGFGVGLEWGSMEFNIDNIKCLDLILY